MATLITLDEVLKGKRIEYSEKNYDFLEKYTVTAYHSKEKLNNHIRTRASNNDYHMVIYLSGKAKDKLDASYGSIQGTNIDHLFEQILDISGI